jgi:UDP-N-acetylmuramate--alanine ligase
MHIYFSGIGGTGIGPLALIAKQAGFEVSGSDKQQSSYTDYLRKHGISDIFIGQSGEELTKLHSIKPVDWIVYSSALTKEQPDHPELRTATSLGIRTSKRDEFLNYLIKAKDLKLIAIAGTHGKTTTTAMAIWLMRQAGIPVSYSVGAKLPFGEMGEYDPSSEYFVYEADEYDRNFLSFTPDIAIISGIGYDHPDIYPTKESYNQAFTTFLRGVKGAIYAYYEDLQRLNYTALNVDLHEELLDTIKLVGQVNRRDALLVCNALADMTGRPISEMIELMNSFPGLSRRFEMISEHLYSDYAHTPEKVQGAIQVAKELAGENVVVVYEGLHNTRQHFIKDELATLFEGVKKLYIVPSYRAREDESLEDLTPAKLSMLMKVPTERVPSHLDKTLKEAIASHVKSGDLVLVLSAGGGGSLDEWLRKKFGKSL